MRSRADGREVEMPCSMKQDLAVIRAISLAERETLDLRSVPSAGSAKDTSDLAR